MKIDVIKKEKNFIEFTLIDGFEELLLGLKSALYNNEDAIVFTYKKVHPLKTDYSVLLQVKKSVDALKLLTSTLDEIKKENKDMVKKINSLNL